MVVVFGVPMVVSSPEHPVTRVTAAVTSKTPKFRRIGVPSLEPKSAPVMGSFITGTSNLAKLDVPVMMNIHTFVKGRFWT
jgi:hypothetical protein